jgi:hypothetical protein
LWWISNLLSGAIKSRAIRICSLVKMPSIHNHLSQMWLPAPFIFDCPCCDILSVFPPLTPSVHFNLPLSTSFDFEVLLILSFKLTIKVPSSLFITFSVTSSARMNDRVSFRRSIELRCAFIWERGSHTFDRMVSPAPESK